MLPSRLAILAAATALCAALTTSSTAQTVAWAWVSPAGKPSTFTPDLAYQFSTNGATITATRDPAQQNRFRIHFPGMAPPATNPQIGVVLANAYGGNHTAVVNSWNVNGADLDAWIETFTPTGAAANDRPFVVCFRRYLGNYGNAYVWAGQPTTSSYTPAANYSQTPTGTPSIVRTGTGAYTVTLPGLGQSTSGELGTVQVATYSTTMRRTKVGSWLPSASGLDLEVEVRTFDAVGSATDCAFVLWYHEWAAQIDDRLGSGAMVFADDPTAASYTPNPFYTDSNGSLGPRNGERIERLGSGLYRVSLPCLAPSNSSMAMASAYGPGASHATVRNWESDGHGGNYVYVETWSPSGVHVDSRFTLDYLTNRPDREVAWAWVAPSGQPTTFTPSPGYQFTPNGDPVTVERLSPSNRFRVHFPTRKASGWAGSFLTSSYGGTHTATVQASIQTLDGVEAIVNVYEIDGTPASDKPFVIHYEHSGEPDGRHAYVAAFNPVNLWTVGMWNGSRPEPTAAQFGTGRYRVRLPGLAPLGAELGHVQASSWSGSPSRLQVLGWFASAGDVYVDLQRTDATGTPEDGPYFVTYNEAAAPIPPRWGSGAHVWADNPTAAHYTPNASYTDSNGTLGPANAETIDRLALGRYRINLPNLAPADSSTALVSPYGTTAHAAVESWGGDPAGGAAVIVRTYSATGAPADGRFLLTYLTNRPAIGTPAINQPYGGGCNGPVLTGLTRPVLNTPWRLGLTGVPAGAVLGFVQLGFANPALSFGAQAPGCTQYTDNLSTVLVPLPIPSPCYSLSIPAESSFLGLEIRAQGGAFVPGINAFDLAASNGLLGVVGDV
ncbi:MAG: hypothetical protein KDE27_00355 [Planctomycetes bacterium]|nr:hypothetical protein [Planctomycetota bacterium]